MLQNAMAEGADDRLGMSEKVVRLHRALARTDIPHAIGGAIAVDYYRVPRATIDIDLNIFLPSADGERAINVLAAEFEIADRVSLLAEITDRDQGKTDWGETRIDLFFLASKFNESMASRVREVPYADATIPILSAEDIVVIKAVFDRTQDWADIEAVCSLGAAELDVGYMKHWLEEILGQDDPRIARLVGLVEAGK